MFYVALQLVAKTGISFLLHFFHESNYYGQHIQNLVAFTGANRISSISSLIIINLHHDNLKNGISKHIEALYYCNKFRFSRECFSPTACLVRNKKYITVF